MKPKNRLNSEIRKTKMRLLGIEILDSSGEPREQAMKTYRKLLHESADEMMYLARA